MGSCWEKVVVVVGGRVFVVAQGRLEGPSAQPLLPPCFWLSSSRRSTTQAFVCSNPLVKTFSLHDGHFPSTKHCKSPSERPAVVRVRCVSLRHCVLTGAPVVIVVEWGATRGPTAGYRRPRLLRTRAFKLL